MGCGSMQEAELCEFKAALVYRVSAKTAELHSKPLSQKTNKRSTHTPRTPRTSKMTGDNKPDNPNSVPGTPQRWKESQVHKIVL